MSAWVAPSIAAEIWGVSVDHILAGIADGSIQSLVDGQFLFVDLHGRGFAQSSPRPPVSEPVITKEEFAALTFRPINRDEESPEDSSNDESSADFSHWRAAREQTSHLRQPPDTLAA
jgi:hypothetical protein